MFDTNNIEPKEVKLLNGQIDIILKALELYSFNLHNTWGVDIDSDSNELKNALVFHTYQGLLEQRDGEYRISYDLIKEYELYQLRKKRKKKIYFPIEKNIS